MKMIIEKTTSTVPAFLGKSMLPLMVLAGIPGCTPPEVHLHSAPMPVAQEAARRREARTRVVPVAFASIFPKVLGVLMDEGYLVRSANGTLGTVSFFQQWQDPDQADANIIQEGSLLFTPEGPESTQVRLMLTGSSQRLQANDSKRKYSAMVMVGVVQQDLGPEECSKVLDLLEKGLVTRSPG